MGLSGGGAGQQSHIYQSQREDAPQSRIQSAAAEFLTPSEAFARISSFSERHNRIMGDQRMGLGRKTETTRWRFLAGGRG
jgi:hypothetical protein